MRLIIRAVLRQTPAPLGVAVGAEGLPAYGVEFCSQATASLCLFQTTRRQRRAVESIDLLPRLRRKRQVQVRRLLRGRDNGAPGLRPQHHAHGCAAFVIGPDGQNLEAVCHSR